MLTKPSLVQAVASMLSLAACTGSASTPTDSIHAEVEPFAGFGYDSGPVPSSSPVSIEIAASAGGKLTLDAEDETPGSGRFALDAGIDLAVTIKSTLPGASYEGPLQGAPALSIAIGGETAFDPMVVGHQATLSAAVTPADLVTLPLAQAMGIPGVTGDLTIQLVGGTVVSDFVGACAEAGHFSGTITVSGSVTLGGKLTVEVPLVGAKTFDLPTMDMAVPAGQYPVSFTTPDDPMATGCTAGTGGGDGGGSGSPDPDAGTPDPDPDPDPGTPDPDAVWDIVIHDVTFSGAPSGNWDANGGLADPYVIVTINGIEYHTNVLTDQDGYGLWDVTIGQVTTADLSAGFSLVLLDHDSTAADEVGGVPAYDLDHPGEDYIASVSSLASLDGSSHLIDMSCCGVTADVLLTFQSP